MMLSIHILICIFWFCNWEKLSYLKPHCPTLVCGLSLWRNSMDLDMLPDRPTRRQDTRYREACRTRATGSFAYPFATTAAFRLMPQKCGVCPIRTSELCADPERVYQVQRIIKYTLFILSIYFPDTLILAHKSTLKKSDKTFKSLYIPKLYKLKM